MVVLAFTGLRINITDFIYSGDYDHLMSILVLCLLCSDMSLSYVSLLPLIILLQ